MVIIVITNNSHVVVTATVRKTIIKSLNYLGFNFHIFEIRILSYYMIYAHIEVFFYLEKRKHMYAKGTTII